MGIPAPFAKFGNGQWVASGIVQGRRKVGVASGISQVNFSD